VSSIATTAVEERGRNREYRVRLFAKVLIEPLHMALFVHQRFDSGLGCRIERAVLFHELQEPRLPHKLAAQRNKLRHVSRGLEFVQRFGPGLQCDEELQFSG
jgi:hypothetical protein